LLIVNCYEVCFFCGELSKIINMIEAPRGNASELVVAGVVTDAVTARLRTLGFVDADEKVEASRIYVPQIEVVNDLGRSQNALEETGLGSGFSVIYVGSVGKGLEEPMKVAADMKVIDDPDSYRRREITVCEITLTSELLLGQRSPLIIKLKPRGRDAGDNTIPPSVFACFLSLDNLCLRRTAGLVDVGRYRNEDYTLLITEDRWHDLWLGNVALPKYWKDGIRNGRLFEAEAVPIAKPEPELSPEVLEIARWIEGGRGAMAFEKIKSCLARFPRYSGPVLGKEKVRVASLGKERAPVEIEEKFENSLDITLFDLDPEALSELCGSRNITSYGLLKCFGKKEEKSQHRLFIELKLRGNNIRVDSNPVAWDFASSRLVDSWKYLPHSAQNSQGFRKLLADPLALIPVLLSEIQKPVGNVIVGVGELRMEEGKGQMPERKRKRGRGGETRRALRNNPGFGLASTSSLIKEPETPAVVVSHETKDSPDDKKKYWKDKRAKKEAARRRRNRS